MEKHSDLNKFLISFEISNKLDRYELLSEFLKQVGKQLYIRELTGESTSEADVKMFSDKFQEFKDFVDKLCTLPATKA
jgi:hypothetical protein